MPLTSPLPASLPDDADDVIKDLYAKVESQRGRVPVEVRMMAHVPTFANDMFENQQRIIHDGLDHLSLQQREAVALAVSSANFCVNCIKAHRRKCIDAGYSESQTIEILALAAQCAMLNTNHQFRHAVSDDRFMQMTNPLKTDAMQAVSLDALTVELICLAVSSVNACELCIQNHTQKAMDAGASVEQIDEAVLVASVMTAYNWYFRMQHD